MMPYVQREIFGAHELAMFARAQHFVGRVGAGWGNELRCHELARAVDAVLDVKGSLVVDGSLGIVEHSWIEFAITRHRPVVATTKARPPRDPLAARHAQITDAEMNILRGDRLVILDVYCPGRLPQVQLIDSFFLLRTRYEAGEPRTDINARIVARLVEEMRGES